MTDQPAVTVIMVHRARPESAVATAEALCDQEVPLRLVIVDNGSPARDLATLRAAIPSAEVIELGSNTGFGPAANTGLRRWLDEGPAAGDWAVVCPHDAVVEPHCLERLLSAAKARPRAGLASAEYGDVGQYGTFGDRVLPTVNPWLGPILETSDRRPGWEDADHPHGTLMILRRQCLEQIGLFDERYFAYCEEAELGLRAQRAGWQVGVVWGAVVRNAGMTSEQGVPEYLMMRNSLMLQRDHFGTQHATVLFCLYLFHTVRGLLSPSRRTLYWHTRGRLLAMADFARGRYGPAPVVLSGANKSTRSSHRAGTTLSNWPSSGRMSS